MNCEQIHPLLTRHLLGDLDADTAKTVAAHITTCAVCQAESRHIEPTLALLSEALSEPVGVHHLTTRRRERILHPKRRPRVIQWVADTHPRLAVAAGILFVFGFLWLLHDSLSPQTDAVRTISVRCVEPEVCEKLDERRDVTGHLSAQPDSVVPGDHFYAALPSADAPKPSPPPLPEGSPRPAPTTDFSPQPVEFDAVAMTKSPVIMKGIYGSGSSGARGQAIHRYGGKAHDTSYYADADELEIAIDDVERPSQSLGDRPVTTGVGYGVDSDGDGLSDEWEPSGGGRSTASQKAGTRTRRSDVNGSAPVLGGVPMMGRLFTSDKKARVINGATTAGGSDGKDLAGEVVSTTRPLAKNSYYKATSGAKKPRPNLKPQTPRSTVSLAEAEESLRSAESALIEHNRLHDIGRLEARGTMESRYADALASRKHELNNELTRLESGAAMPATADHDTSVVSTFSRSVASLDDSHPVGGNVVRESREERANVLRKAVEGIEAAEFKWKAKELQQREREAEKKRFKENIQRAEAAYLDAYERAGREAAPEEAARVAEIEEDSGEANFKAVGVNAFLVTGETPFSTFAIDVDTAAYTLGRNYLRQGLLPPAESVRTEEYVNFFDYAYKAPTRETFAVHADVAPSAFGHGLHLMRIGIKGRRLGREEQRQASLTFLIDTSGSMNQPDRLKLVQSSLELLIGEMKANDLVAIVQYDSHARLVLEHTRAAKKGVILKAIKSLQCGGSTNLEEGMHRAYELAAANFIPKGENRVLLLSDGVANLGSGAAEDILAKVDTYRRQGITCSVFGFGMGTYDDTMLETLANKGDGAYAFIDSNEEARRVFVDDLSGTLNTIAADVKIQVEYHPTHVARYRQIGYENRQLRKQDFRNDAIDAGEVGSGQSVTALYELAMNPDARPEPYEAETQSSHNDVIATVRVRYRRIDTGAVEEIEHRVRRRDILPRFETAPPRFRLGAAVAEFSEILRGSPFAAGSTTDDVAAVLRPVALEMPLDGYVQELLRMVDGAKGMSRGQ